jgi:CubicO group peptidase (beta-lactamase class C family)
VGICPAAGPKETVMVGGFHPAGLARLQRVMAGHVERGAVPGLVWLLARGEDVRVGVAGPITVRDLLTFRLGLGGDFTGAHGQPAMARAAELRLGVGPPAPAGTPEPTEYLRRLGTLPLEYQPGERWLYHTGSDVLGVLIARAAGQPFDAFLAERVFAPLGMTDTGFAVPAADLHRFGPSYWRDPATAEVGTYDPTGGQWSTPPAFPGGGAGLVSSADDFAAVAAMLRAGGSHRGVRLLSRGAVAVMTTNHLTPQQLAVCGPDPSGALGWGFGTAVQLRRTGPTRSVGSYGWDGGMGTSWSNDPAEDLTAILMTNQMWTSPVPPPVAQDFLTCAYTALDG